MDMQRRAFLGGAAASAAAWTAAGPAPAIEPIRTPGRKRLKVSLAAYSLRRQLQAEKGSPGH
ncbi:MAG: hypothetical protein R3236_11395, partial [Phycisphaeraceae bacterium]|nr:hypothetical protein [Phycisphaeraceae bacterium]